MLLASSSTVWKASRLAWISAIIAYLIQIPTFTLTGNLKTSELTLRFRPTHIFARDEMPEATALRLAENKAHAVAAIYHDVLIIAADQVAVMEGIQLGKPLNYANAVKQLRLMRGKEVIFYTALCVLNSRTNRLQTRVVPYFIKFRELSDQQIEHYLSKEQPYHCAGSAKSEGLGIALIERMRGDDPNALIGLPLIALVDMLLAEGVEII